jgi:nitrite reductase/ring-hydroxylating ferredoxin subunit
LSGAAGEPAAVRPLCRLDEIPDGTGKGFWFGGDVTRFGIFVLRCGKGFVAYANSCPHRGTPLDWQPDRFLDVTGRLIQCSTHGALFRIDDGFCVRGPCAGAALTRVAVSLRNGILCLSEEAIPF